MSSYAKIRQKETKMWREIHFSNNNNFNSFLLENVPNSKWKSSRYGLSRLRLVNTNVRRAVMGLLQQLRHRGRVVPACLWLRGEDALTYYWAGDHFPQEKCRVRLSCNK